MRLHLSLLDPPEPLSKGHRLLRTNVPGKERTQDSGAALDKDPLVPKAVAGSQGKAFALAVNGTWVPGSLGVGGGAPSPYVQSPHSPWLLYQAKSLFQLSAYQEPSSYSPP